MGSSSSKNRKTLSLDVFRKIFRPDAFTFAVFPTMLKRERRMNRPESLADTAEYLQRPAGSVSSTSPSPGDWGKVIIFVICAGLLVEAWDTLPSQFARAKDISSQAIASLQRLTTDKTTIAPAPAARSTHPVTSPCTSNRPSNHQTVVIYRVVTASHGGCR